MCPRALFMSQWCHSRDKTGDNDTEIYYLSSWNTKSLLPGVQRICIETPVMKLNEIEIILPQFYKFKNFYWNLHSEERLYNDKKMLRELIVFGVIFAEMLSRKLCLANLLAQVMSLIMDPSSQFQT